MKDIKEKMPTLNDVGLYRNSLNALDHCQDKDISVFTLGKICRILCTIGYVLCAILGELVVARIERELNA